MSNQALNADNVCLRQPSKGREAIAGGAAAAIHDRKEPLCFALTAEDFTTFIPAVS